MRIVVVFIFTIVAGLASALGGLHESDTRLEQTELTGLLAGQVIEFFDGSKSTFLNSGRYRYTYTDDGPVWEGTYVLGDNSQVCINFDNGSGRCDFFVKDGTRAILITAEGVRFPVRNITVAAD